MAEQASDEQLIQWYQKGNADAFATLYGRYKKALYHYFYRQVQANAIADELHQDVWLKIIKSSSGFSHRCSFKTWLYTIARNRLVDHYRGSNKQPLQLVAESQSDCDPDNELQDHKSRGPEALVQEQQINSQVQTAIDLLPEPQKEVFLLYEHSGLTLDEIAVITDSSFESTKSRLRYAVKKLRQHLAQHLGVTL